jgi:HK97 family phage prohead protease
MALTKDFLSIPDLRMSPLLEVKLADAAAGLIAGHASVFGPPADLGGDIIQRGAYAKSIAEMKASGDPLPMLWSHNPHEPIGAWEILEEDDHGLKVRGRLNSGVAKAREILALAKQQAVTGMSIGYRVPPGGRTANGDGTFTLSEIALMEISLCVFPMHRRARITEAKSLTKSAVETILRESGVPKAAATRIAAGGWPALAGADEDEAKAKQLVAALKASAQRLTKGI